MRGVLFCLLLFGCRTRPFELADVPTSADLAIHDLGQADLATVDLSPPVESRALARCQVQPDGAGRVLRARHQLLSVLVLGRQRRDRVVRAQPGLPALLTGPLSHRAQ